VSERVDLREFVGAFVVEAEELIALANAALLDIEAGNASGAVRPKSVRDLFRALHTIKGLASMIGVEPIVEIAHALESLVRTADRGTAAPSTSRSRACARSRIACARSPRIDRPSRRRRCSSRRSPGPRRRPPRRPHRRR
jgi:chemotaxis protein histidine kinase CheA